MDPIKFISIDMTQTEMDLLEMQEHSKNNAIGIHHKTMKDLPKYGKSTLEEFIKKQIPFIK